MYYIVEPTTDIWSFQKVSRNIVNTY